MPVLIGTGPGEFVATIDHVNNGEFGNEVVFRRPSIDLENRTDALRIFVENEEVRLDVVSAKADTNEADIAAINADTTPADYIAHAADDSRHTVYASELEARAGTETEKVTSPAVDKVIAQERISHVYDAIVGDTSLAGITHEFLSDALSSAVDGWRILVTRSEFIDATFNITNDNLEINFRRGATFIAGTATTCFNIAADDVYISKPRILGFSTDAIKIIASSERTMIRDARFTGNGSDITDLGSNTSILGTIVE